MTMDLFSLSADNTIQEYELVSPPKENHIREEQVGKLLYDASVYSMETTAILRERKELTDEEFDLEAKHIQTFFNKHNAYLFTTLDGEHHRFYNAYCWSRYKEKKQVIFQPSLFYRMLFDWRFAEEEAEGSTEDAKKEVAIETKSNHLTDTTDDPSDTSLHVFMENQMVIRLQMLEEALYARHVEDYYEQHKEFPEPDWILEATKPKVTKQLSILRQFIEAGQLCGNLDGRTIMDDCFFSFEEEKLLFVYGKSIYKFTVMNEAFYLRGEKVDLPSFFNQLRYENKRVWKHVIRLGKLFERKGIPYCNADKNNYFFLYRIVEEKDVFYLRYKQAEMLIRWDERNLYRMNGEKINVPAILVHEMIELNGSRKKAQLKAKQYFQMFLTKEEKQQFVKTKSVFVKGKNYDYLFCPEMTANSVLRIEKATGKKESMCVMFDDPYIPRYDVIASALLMVKTGQEEQLNRIANTFACSAEHERLLKKQA